MDGVTEDGDTLHRFLFEHAAIRGEALRLDAGWRAILETHDYPPVVRRMLGEALAAAVLLSSTLKFKGSLTLQIQSDGPLHLLVAEATSERTFRGMAQWRDQVPEGELAAIFGRGRMVITLDPRDGGERYQGVVALEGDSLAAAVENYLARSEQLATRIWLAVDEQRAAGLLLQRLPGDTPDADTDAWDRVGHLAATVRPEELLELDGAALRHRLFHEEDLRVFEPEPVHFHCSCSRERVARMLLGLGADEVRSIVADEGQVEVHCEFCNRRYAFDPVDAEQLLADGGLDGFADDPATHH